METLAKLFFILLYLVQCSIASDSGGADSDRPQLMPLMLAKSYLEGSDVNIYCVVAAGNRQLLKHDWKKNNMKLNSGYNIKIEHQGSDSVVKLYNISSKDAGVYTCIARNEFGQDSNSGTLVINVPLRWIEEPQDVVIGAGKELQMRCSASGQPKPDVKWYKRNGLPSKLLSISNTTSNSKSNKEQLISEQGEFSITSSSIHDSGLYECVAVNGVDRDLRKVIEVKIQGKQ